MAAKKPTEGQLPLLVPTSTWSCPVDLPDLTGGELVALDLETRDVSLSEGHGPGWAHKAGYICGVSASWMDGSEIRSIYAPVRHPDSKCLDPIRVKNWVKAIFAGARRIVFHNAPYDLGWLRVEWDLEPPVAPDDTTAMAVMIDETTLHFDLDYLCHLRGLPGKDEGLLREAASAYGWEKGDVKKNLWQLPARFVGNYAEADTRSTLLLAQSLEPQMHKEGVWNAYHTERSLIPLCLEMRRRGIRIDEDAADQAVKALEAKRDTALKELEDITGERRITMETIRTVKWLETHHDLAKIKYPRTPKTNRGSFRSGKTGGWMRDHHHPLPRTIAVADKYDEAANKFIRGFIMDYAHRGRIHASINQFRSDEGGTRSHRFSYSDPALQQMPERDPELGPLIRGLFLPEEGTVWGAHDYSQQEYRMIVHCAALLNCTKVEEAVRAYHDNPKTDFHQLVVEMTGLDRKRAKDTNFAKAFGAGVPKFASMIGRPEEEAREIYDQYDKLLPFVSEAARMCTKAASNRGYIKLIDGARCHFPFYLPADSKDFTKEFTNPQRLDKARELWGNIRLKRTWVHKAFNRFVQGSSARQTKLAMLQCWREGLVPMLQMHDDLNFSHAKEAEALRVAEIMRSAVKLLVPAGVDSEFGPNWGMARYTWKEANERSTKK
jgi:Mesyanzhinovviridae DNA polymerase